MASQVLWYVWNFCNAKSNLKTILQHLPDWHQMENASFVKEGTLNLIINKCSGPLVRSRALNSSLRGPEFSPLSQYSYWLRIFPVCQTNVCTNLLESKTPFGCMNMHKIKTAPQRFHNSCPWLMNYSNMGLPGCHLSTPSRHHPLKQRMAPWSGGLKSNEAL